MNTTEQVRQTDGKFGHGLDKVCRCGRTKGAHLAARPFAMDDDSCAGFKAAPAALPCAICATKLPGGFCSRACARRATKP